MPEEEFLIGVSQIGTTFAAFVAIFLIFVRKDGRFSLAEEMGQFLGRSKLHRHAVHGWLIHGALFSAVADLARRTQSRPATRGPSLEELLLAVRARSTHLRDHPWLALSDLIPQGRIPLSYVATVEVFARDFETIHRLNFELRPDFSLVPISIAKE